MLFKAFLARQLRAVTTLFFDAVITDAIAAFFTELQIRFMNRLIP
jgi:hypothetical protein